MPGHRFADKATVMFPSGEAVPNGNCPPERSALRVLFIEDDVSDVDLARRELEAARFDLVSDVAMTIEQFRAFVTSNNYDVILADYRLPGNTGMDCLEILKAEGIDTPFILVTGSLGDEKAVECIRAGATDYVLKDHLARLPVAIRRALAEQRLRAEQKKTQEELRCSEAGYRSLIQSAPCGILRVGAQDGRVLEANGALAEMLGYASASELLCNSNDVMALDPARLAALSSHCKQDGQLVASDVEWSHKDGARVVVELRGRLLRDASGAPACFELVAENRTKRRQAEERINQLNRLYAVLSRTGHTIVHTRERSKLFQEICRVVVEEGQFQMAWIGLVTEGNIVKPVASWGDERGYLDGNHVTSTLEPAGSGPVGMAIRETRHAICNHLMTDPRMAPWWNRASRCEYGSVGAFPLIVSGFTVGTIAIYAAVPDFFDAESVALLDELAANLSFALDNIAAEESYRRAVAELDQFFAVSLDMLCIATADGYITRLNPAWERTLGFTPEEMRSRPWVDFVHGQDRAAAIEARDALSAGQIIERLELRFLSKDGSYRWLMGSATPGAGQGTVFAAVADITERKLLEERLRDQNLKLEEQYRSIEAANRMKSAFLANMSHELRSPLNGVIGFTELLYDGKLGVIPEKPREYLNRIHKSAKHLLELINGVLDLSKVEAGRIELHPEPVRLSAIVDEVEGILSALASEKRIDIANRLDPQVDIATLDAGRFKQILHNYLSNALKFTGEGGKVEVRLKPEGDSAFRLEVADTGIGIPRKDIPRLFTEFQQLDSTKAKRYQGSGLGLALTKRIVEAQGGRVGVESFPGKGSTFFAVLPARCSGLRRPVIPIAEEAKAPRSTLERRCVPINSGGVA